MTVPRRPRALAAALALLAVVHLTGCGTLLYPERRGQTHGRIDPAVAILDGIGLLVWIIPGLVAFAVDFSTGAIYMPPDESVLDEAPPGEWTIVTVDPARLDAAVLERVVSDHLGRPVSLEAPGARVVAPGAGLRAALEDAGTPRGR